MKKIIGSLALAAFVAAMDASAQSIGSYDVLGYQPPVGSGWSSTYSGTTTVNADGTFDLTGGSGTLNDGLIPANSSNNMLFLQAGVVIVLHLDQSTALSEIDLFGGMIPFNGIPGAIASATISFGGTSVALSSAGWGPACQSGPCNDRFSLAGTALQGISTDTITISNIQNASHGDLYNIAEISVAAGSGLPVSAVPEPGSVVMLLGGLGLIGAVGWRRATATLI